MTAGILIAGKAVRAEAGPPREQRTTRWGRARYGVALLMLTALGGVLRFAYLDRPALWGDEAATYMRTCGDYRDLLDLLQKDGFAPLHYELYWLIGQFVKLMPGEMRVVPAIAGTAMIPAMYFLTRQLAGRSTALLSAAFTAVSAYMLVYSRDAKMYMHFWLFSALAAGCLLWWLRTGLRVAWLAWIASGLACLGLHTAGALVLAIYPLMLLTQKRLHWRTTVLFLVGLAVISAGSAGHYLGFNRWVEYTGGGITPGLSTPAQATGSWGLSGLGWIDEQTRGKSGWELLRESMTAYLFAFSRAEEWTETGQVLIPPAIQTWSAVTLWVFVALLALGTLPWPKRWQGVDETAGDRSWWRGVLWVSAWLILPTYGFFYCRSVDQFASPAVWIDAVRGAAATCIGPRAWVWALAAVGMVALVGLWRPLGAVGAAALGALILGMLGWAISHNGTNWLDAWVAMLLRPKVLWPASAVAVGLIVYYCGPTWGARAGRPVQLALIAGFMIGACWGAFAIWDHLAREAARNGVTWRSMWMPRYLGIIWPAVAMAAAALLVRLPTRPLRWAAVAVVLGVNVAQGTARWWAANEPPIDAIAADVVVSAKSAATTRAYLQVAGGTGSPAQGSIYNHVGRYYFAVLGRRPTHVESVWQGWGGERPQMWNYTSPDGVRGDVRRQTNLDRVIVWQMFGPAQALPAEDPVLAALGDGWQRVNERVYPVRCFWNWQEVRSYLRREYARRGTDASATAR